MSIALPPNTLAENLDAVKKRIAKALADASRPDEAAALTAVSKTFPIEAIQPLIDLGHRQFGENRVQEAQAKWPDLKAATPDLRLHLIGSLQTNKATDAVALFDVIEVVDREKLAKSLHSAMEKVDRWPRCLIQVNTGDEPQKGGIAPSEAVQFAQWARADLGLPVEGFMAIPPAEDAPAPHFALLYELAQKAELPRLSMGMSSDYETAVHLGATDVRVGSGIFGARG